MALKKSEEFLGSNGIFFFAIYIYTVGAEIMACTKIMALSTSGDDFMHLKTSHIKSRVIL